MSSSNIVLSSSSSISSSSTELVYIPVLIPSTALSSSFVLSGAFHQTLQKMVESCLSIQQEASKSDAIEQIQYENVEPAASGDEKASCSTSIICDEPKSHVHFPSHHHRYSFPFHCAPKYCVRSNLQSSQSSSVLDENNKYVYWGSLWYYHFIQQRSLSSSSILIPSAISSSSSSSCLLANSQSYSFPHGVNHHCFEPCFPIKEELLEEHLLPSEKEEHETNRSEPLESEQKYCCYCSLEWHQSQSLFHLCFSPLACQCQLLFGGENNNCNNDNQGPNFNVVQGVVNDGRVLLILVLILVLLDSQDDFKDFDDFKKFKHGSKQAFIRSTRIPRIPTPTTTQIPQIIIPIQPQPKSQPQFQSQMLLGQASFFEAKSQAAASAA